MVQEYGANPYRDLFLLVDEWHSLFTSYSFRHQAVVKLLQEASLFERVTYMSTTPIEPEFMLEELSHLPVVELQ